MRTASFLLVALCLIPGLASAQGYQAPPPAAVAPLSLPDLVQRIKPAVAWVQVKTTGGKDACGSAFTVDAQGLLVTALHVVEDAQTVNVQFPGGTAQRADVVVVDIPNDLAVLRIAPQSDQLLTVLPIVDTLRAGQDAIILGYPLCSGPDPTVTRGIVSGVNRVGPIGGMAVVQIDAAMNPGNSGGPVITNDGAVIGVADQARVRAFGRPVQATNFAIPYDAVRANLNKANGPGRPHAAFTLPLQTTATVPLTYKGTANSFGAAVKDVACVSPPAGAIHFVGVRGDLKASGALAIRVFLTMRPDDEGAGQFGVLARVGGANVQTVDQQATQDYSAHDVCLSYLAQGGLPGLYGFIPLGFEATYILSYSVWSPEVAGGGPQAMAPAPAAPRPVVPVAPQAPGPAVPSVTPSALAAPAAPPAARGIGDQPAWSVGDTWVYAGASKPTTLTVLGIASDHWSVMQKVGDETNVIPLKFDFAPNTHARFEWPLAVGKTWTFNWESRAGNGISGVNSYTTTLTVVAFEPVTVHAGTFDAFRIEGRECNNTQQGRCGRFVVWYAPQVKNYVKIDFVDAFFFNYSKANELWSYELH